MAPTFFHAGLKPNEICHSQGEPNPGAAYFCIITSRGRAPRIVYGASMEECAEKVTAKRSELGIKAREVVLSKVDRMKLRSKLQYYEQFRPSVVAYVARELAEKSLWDENEGFSGDKVLENAESGVLFWAAGLGDRREVTPHALKKPRAEAVGVILELMLQLYPNHRRAYAYIGRRFELAKFFGHRPETWDGVTTPSEPWEPEAEEL